MSKPFPSIFKWLGVALALTGLIALLFGTPGGLLRKADYVGAAVCHRRPSHSYSIDGQQLPLCQRCTGTFPGALTGVLIHWGLWRRRRSMRFPRWPFFVPALVFAALWALDGINSATADSQFYGLLQQWMSRPPGVGILGYAPQPWLRLLSGSLMGMSMSIILVPAFNQSLWSDGEDSPTLRSWHEMALLIMAELAMTGLILLLVSSSSRLALWGVTIYSIAGVLTMFVLLGAMMFVLLTHRDGEIQGWRSAWIPLVWGFVFAFLVVAAMDSVRLWVTGTIDGVPGLE
ncbi:MAG: DUF2085 domain-containing protein [Anaerolineae bacterium]